MPKFVVRKPKKNDERRLQSSMEKAEHDRRVYQALRDNLSELLAKTSIRNLQDGTPITETVSLRDPGFFYANPSGGSGGEAAEGEEGDASTESASAGDEAGDNPGKFEYEKKVTPEEIISSLFDKVELPAHIKKRIRGTRKRTRHVGIQRTGPHARLDKKGTFRRKQAREIKSGKKQPFRSSDRRYGRIKKRRRHSIHGHIYFIRDKSSSMTEKKVALMKGLMLLVWWFLKKKYNELGITYICHDTEAEQVSEQEFFAVTSSGGTELSSGANKAVELAKNGSEKHFYVFQFSDGLNHTGDKHAFNEVVEEILSLALFYGYVEVLPGTGGATSLWDDKYSMAEMMNYTDRKTMHPVRLTKFKDVGDMFLRLFKSEQKRKE